MGVVFEADDPDTGRRVALKTVRVPERRLLSTLRREIRTLVRLRHPGIVRIVDHGSEEGIPWYAMELCQGVPLRQYLGLYSQGESTVADRWHEAATELWNADAAPRPSESVGDGERGSLGREPLVQVMTVMVGICESLAYLHGEGVVHGDLKPANILVGTDGKPVLVDFGVATQFGGAGTRESLELSLPGGGTSWYASPEQTYNLPLDPRSDLYSLGCIMYELLAGRPPFVGDHVLRQHREETPPAPSSLVEGVPPALDQLVLQLLEKDPRNRGGYAFRVASMLTTLGACSSGWDAAPRGFLYRPALVGREALMAELSSTLSGLIDGVGEVLLLAGEPGVGKTRVAMGLADRARRLGSVVVHSDCSQVEDGGTGLSPLLQLLADKCRKGGDGDTDYLLGDEGPVLAQQEPSLAEIPAVRASPPPIELEPVNARQRFWRALADVMARLCDRRPVTFLIDDLHLADPLTVGFLDHLARRVESPMLVIGTYRLSEATEKVRALSQLGLEERLARLDEISVAAMIADMLALGKAPASLVKRLYKVSEGNPLFVTESLHSLVSSGVLRLQRRGEWRVWEDGAEKPIGQALMNQPFPESLRALLQKRIGDVSLVARTTLEEASILGREFDVELLHQSSSRAEDELLDGLAELLAVEILVERQPGIVRFAHDQIREVVLGALDGARLRSLHRAVVGVLESRGGSSVRLGNHLLEAGEAERARVCFLEAADAAMARYALEEAEHCFRSALSVDSSADERIDMLNGYGARVLYPSGQLAEAVEAHREALELAERIGDSVRVGRSMRSLARTRNAQGKFGPARTLALRALNRTEGGEDPAEETRTLLLLGEILRATGEREQAAAYLARARRIAEQTLDLHSEAMALRGLVILKGIQGRYEEAERDGRRGLTLLQSARDRRGEATLLATLANIKGYQYRLDEACDLLAEALQIQEEIGRSGGAEHHPAQPGHLFVPPPGAGRLAALLRSRPEAEA